MKAHNKYLKSFTLGVQNSMEYRTNFLLSLLSVIFPIVMQYFLWTAIFSSSSSSVVYGYTYKQMIVYTVIAGLVSKIVATGFEYEINEDIKYGGLNKFIVQPISYFAYRISCFLGQKFLQSGIMIGVICGSLVALKLFLNIEIDIVRIILFFIILVFSIVLNFLIAYGISSIAFWMTEISYLFAMTAMFVNIVSGGVLPLDVFGKSILAIFNYLPFKYTIYFPVNVINGRLTYGETLNGLIIQCLWIILATFLSNLLWKLGTKKYIAVGG